MIWNNAKFWNVLEDVQRTFSARYPELFSGGQEAQLLPYLEQYLLSQGMTDEAQRKPWALHLFWEMTEYSFLTPLLEAEDLEEININRWDDISLLKRDGSVGKLKEHFRNTTHALDILKRLLHHSGMVLDQATPVAQGQLPGNKRITVLQYPLVDEDCGVSASIRFLHPSSVTLQELETQGFATGEMLTFLCCCLRYGVPFVIAGATGSGKTTLLNALLATVPDEKRIFTIESGARELSLLRRSGTQVQNNVVHTLSRPSEDASSDVSQEDLVVAALRFHPDIVCVGEMRDVECFSAVEASLTGHTVVSTVHSGAGEAAHTRISLLCQKRFPMDFATSMQQTAMAFPVVAYTQTLENHRRVLLDITECSVGSLGIRSYRPLFQYRLSGTAELGSPSGNFWTGSGISESLAERFLRGGAPMQNIDALFTVAGEENVSWNLS